jgi:hypothetical protein
MAPRYRAGHALCHLNPAMSDAPKRCLLRRDEDVDDSWWHRLNAGRTLPTVARIRTNRSVRVCEAKRDSVMLTSAGADGARVRVVERLADLTPQPNGRGGLRRYDQNERVGHLGPAGELPGLTDGTRHAPGDSDRMSCVIKILPVASGSKSDSHGIWTHGTRPCLS